MFNYKHIFALRKLDRSDIQELLNLKIYDWECFHSTPILNLDDQFRWFDDIDKNVINPKELYLIVQNIHNYNRIGLFSITNINWINREGTITWAVFKESRKSGYGAELINAGNDFCKKILNLHRLTAEILETNISSIKIAERSGFIKEGVKKERVYKNGKYTDSIIYGRIL